MASKNGSNEKAASLRADGTLNPRPEGVRDECFVQSEFFDARDMLQVKYELLRRVDIEKQPVAHATARFGLSRPTFYKMKEDFARGGLSGLLPTKRGPKGPHKLTDEVMAFIDHYRSETDPVDAINLAEKINVRFGLSIHPRTLARALARQEKKHQ